MTYSNVALKEKIMEMYPDIRDHQVGFGLVFDEEKNAYLLTFTRGTEILSTHLEKKDADACMNGTQCVYLGVQIAQFIRNFEDRKQFDLSAA
jgi:hypothetical protein